MANHKSALKRIKQSEKRRLRNRQANSQLKTVLKSFYSAVEDKIEGPDMVEVHRRTVSQIGRAAAHGVLHKRTASRKISRITACMQKAQAQVALSAV
ncbi:MAG: 30S ribosomal protein S20 [Deltaproteobacteria bacterium]|nr:30S ribosomal protein S20 [Deltaproteobacteria bacterium]